MRDVWIYAGDAEGGADLGRQLAGLGYRPRHVRANGTLRPTGDDGAVTRRPELVVVVGDPGLCPRLRADEELAEVPLVLTLTAAELGPELPDADELLVAPFEPSEIEARVARARRRAHGVQESDVVRTGSLEVNLATYQVTIDGVAVDFTYTEYELLKFLVTHPGRVFSREALLNAVWGYDYYGGARTVDVHVRRLRAKLGHEHAGRITTVRSVGYRWEP